MSGAKGWQYNGERADLPWGFSVDAQGPINTGVLDKDGNPIYRDRPRIGYVTEFSKPRIRVKAISR